MDRNAISLFCSSGIGDLGLHANNINTVISCELLPDRMKLFQENNPGTKCFCGDIWKLENEIYSFAEDCSKLISDDPLMVLINSYTTGLSPSVMEYILGSLVPKKFGGSLFSSEIGLPVTQSGMVLPCGASAMWTK